VKSERGATLVEKALLISLIVVIVILAARMLGARVTKPMCTATGALIYAGDPLLNSMPVEWNIDPNTDLPYCYDNDQDRYLWR
jgi:Flp pilus assembly pilin Flp